MWVVWVVIIGGDRYHSTPVACFMVMHGTSQPPAIRERAGFSFKLWRGFKVDVIPYKNSVGSALRRMPATPSRT